MSTSSPGPSEAPALATPVPKYKVEHKAVSLFSEEEETLLGDDKLSVSS